MFHRSNHFEAMKAGKLTILPWLSWHLEYVDGPSVFRDLNDGILKSLEHTWQNQCVLIKRLTLGVDIMVGTSNRSLERRFTRFSYANFNEISSKYFGDHVWKLDLIEWMVIKKIILIKNVINQQICHHYWSMLIDPFKHHWMVLLSKTK